MFVVYGLSGDVKQSHKLSQRKIVKNQKSAIAPNNWKELRKSSNKVEVSAGFSLEAMKAVEEASSLASKLKHDKVQPIHLFWSSLQRQICRSDISRLDVDGMSMVEKVKNQLSR